MSLLLSLLVLIIIIGTVLWAAQRLLAAFSIGDPIATVIYVLLVLVCLAVVLQYFGIASVPARWR